MARRTYSLDFKVSAAKLVTEQGYGPKAAATSLGVAPSTMQYWVRRFGSAPARPAPPPADPAALKAENDRLREENRRLLMERDILKKLGWQSSLDKGVLKLFQVRGRVAAESPALRPYLLPPLQPGA